MDDFIRRPVQPAELQPRAAATPVSRPVMTASRPDPVQASAPAIQQSEIVEEHPAPVSTATKLPPRARAPIAAITAAIIVSCGLIVLSVVAYNKQQKKVTPAATTPATSETSEATTVQENSDSVDKTMNDLNDSSDFSETDLSDQTLNL